MPSEKVKTAASVVASVGLALLFVLALDAFYPPARGASPSGLAGDILDPTSPDVAHATFAPLLLVQWGTLVNYTGTGPLGINLSVTAPSNPANWTMEAWANETVPAQPSPAPRPCSQSSLHFKPSDWLFETNGGPGGGGAFVTYPGTPYDSLPPDGSQCLLRVLENTTWEVRVCINQDGVPRGLYRDPQGRLHWDGWDRCLTQDYRVGL